jgi:chromosome partitioning protein
MSYVVAIANEKGGVAKTTTTLSLGGALVEEEQRVLLVDLDPLANLTQSLGVKTKGLRSSVADLFLGKQSIFAVSQETNLPNLYLAPSNHDLNMAEQFLVVRDNYELLLRNSLGNMSTFDLILLDCPPALGPLTQNALSAADLLIIPTQCEFFSANALRDMLNLIRTVRTRSNPQLRYRLLLTMIDLRNRIHRNLSKQIRQAFGSAVFNTTIEMDTKLRESPVFGQPVTVYAPNSRGAKQYRQLAQELRHYVYETHG